MLKQHHPWVDDVTIMGIASSHPAACNSLCNLFGKMLSRSSVPSMFAEHPAADGNTRSVDLPFITLHATAALRCSPIPYLSAAPPCGALAGTPGDSYSANTSFFVDHAEPLGILQSYIKDDKWAFGELLDGHEFVVLIPVPGRS